MGSVIGRQTLAEYLQWESRQVERHEFHRGKTWRMEDMRVGHNRIIVNLARHLGNWTDRTPCHVFVNGMKVQVADDTVLYPDVFVSCGKNFRDDDRVVTDPVLIIEVLSPSTQTYDRSQKFAFYRRLPTLREYVLIDPDTRRVETLRLGDDGLWNFIDASDEQAVEFASIDFRLALVDLFHGLDADSPRPAGRP